MMVNIPLQEEPDLEWPMQSLADHWWLVAASRELHQKPMPVQVLGKRIVLFRDNTGVAHALEDKCPHRHVSLSLGSVNNGHIQCAYHGWRFNGQGDCVHIPTQLNDPPYRGHAKSFAVHEAHESLWLWTGKPGNLPACPGWHFQGKEQHAVTEFRTHVHCGLLQTLNNFVDCAHTGFVHAGVFRTAPSRVITATVRETPTGVIIETVGESDQQSLLGRLLVKPGEPITHTDELILPDTVRVTYQFGQRSIVTVSTGLAENECSTRIFTRLHLNLGVVTQPALALMKPLTRKVLAQDKVILDNQGAQLERYGDRWTLNSPADMPTVWVERAFRAWCEKRFPPESLRSHTTHFRL